MKTKRLTRARAVKEFCKTCFGWDGWYGERVGTSSDMAIKMVRECESTECPLFNFRTGVDTTPGRAKRTPTTQQETVRNRLKTRSKVKKVELVKGEKPQCLKTK